MVALRRFKSLLAISLLFGSVACADGPTPSAEAFPERTAGALATELEAEVGDEGEADVQNAGPVILHEVQGPDALKARFEKTMSSRMDEEPLTIAAAGVDALFVIAKVNDLTVEPEGDDIEVKVRVTLLLVDQPSNAVRGSLSASAGATLSARATREAQQETKAEAAEMLADALYLDLKKALAE